MDFSRTHVSFRRSLTSYGKVQRVIGTAIRSRRFQLGAARGLRYLNIGCGANVRPGFVNLDYEWRPGVVCWDITRGLPIADATMQGVFAEHCLEHLPLAQGYALLREIERVLAPGGIARLVVPDAELYLRAYGSANGMRLPYQEQDAFLGMYTRLMSINRVFYVQRDQPYGHNFMYDYETLACVLRSLGFARVERAEYARSGDPVLCIDSEGRRVESLYVEATRA